MGVGGWVGLSVCVHLSVYLSVSRNKTFELREDLWPFFFQDKSNWLGGYKDKDGAEVRALDTLREILSPHFDLVEAFDLPALLMEDPRMWYWFVDHATVWKRKTEQQ